MVSWDITSLAAVRVIRCSCCRPIRGSGCRSGTWRGRCGGRSRELDLAPFMSWYRADGQGNTAYHPRLMVALIMYCYCKGIRSSRAIEMATLDDVGARVICGDLHPDHCDERAVRGPARGAAEGAAGGHLWWRARGRAWSGWTWWPGTARRSRRTRRWPRTRRRAAGLDIAELEKLLEAEVEAWIEEARAADAAEDVLFGGDDGPPLAGGPRRRPRASGLLRSWPGARRRRRSWRPRPGPASSRPRRNGRTRSRSWPRGRTGCRRRAAAGLARAEARAAGTPSARGGGRRARGGGRRGPCPPRPGSA